MCLMEKYLVGVDLDETLLKSDKTISDETVAFVKKFVDDGNFFVIATGRPFQGARNFYQRLGVKMPMIATNGGAIYEFEDDMTTIKNIKTFHMDRNEFLSFFKQVKHMLYSYQVRCPLSYHFYKYELIPFYILHEDPMVSMHENDIEESLEAYPIDADCFVKKDYLDEFLKIISSYKNFKYINWGDSGEYFAFEISSVNASKGTALEYLREQFGVKKENVFGFGDAMNDYDLITTNYGVAMCNAPEEVKKIAKYVSRKDNNNNGVVDFIESIIYKNN